MPYDTEPVPAASAPRNERNRRPSVKAFLVLWVLLICAGIAAAYGYSQHMKKSMLHELDVKWQAQAAAMRADYGAQLSALNEDVALLQSKVDSLNELLTFTKDNASNKTDNSNKLYTQLSEVKKQLAELQKKMDLLK
ncbi:hypothetical protein DCC85_06955 [Paenibacillus sp. CAA11]|uniref:hypothetical protein n=1 Tax=Paenibacillus sp. CAA11 TaxID=1532905 RepID=UPI000D3B671D|nr:hypothetical protein [Paenibacillus sp. CAA11]AWB43985.1 hypothetical protein DCC85_06955 [Paenibacillus sp. CAA11]